MKNVSMLVVMGAVVFSLNAAHADRTVWYVHPDSTLNSIQAALNLCNDNDIVLVAPGTYYENIVWPSKQNIHLISELGPQMTIVDGSWNPLIMIETGVDTTTIINGFTLQHGFPGIACYNNSSPTIAGNIITENDADVGGGIECRPGCSPIISHNTITHNWASHPWGGTGGGIFCEGPSQAIIRDNTIANNWATAGAGGIHCRLYNGIVIGNTISGNAGAGIFCDGFSPTISNNTISGNGKGIWCMSSSPTVSNNSISGNTHGGIICTGSSPIINGCVISDNNEGGINCQPDGSGNPSNPVISYNDIYCNIGFGVCNVDTTIVVSADSNWWGDATGPYHPILNPGGLGDTVSDYVDFIPWLYWPGVEEQPIVKAVETHKSLTATIFRGPLQLPKGRKCRVFDITGRVVEPDKIQPGIYFIKINGVVTQKVVKIR